MRHAGRIDLDGRAIAYLESLAGDGGNDARLQERSRILLLAASGKTDVEIGEQLGISPKT